jgi:DNA-binding CsgD family transcriptional regulator
MTSAPAAFPAPTLAEALGHALPPTLEFTAHELLIAAHVAAGRTAPEIADRLGAPHTPESVHSTVTRLLDKTRSRTRAQMIARLMRAGKIR